MASTLGGIGEDVIEGKTGFKVTPTLKSLSEVINKLDANNTQFKNNIQQVDIRIADEQVVELTEMYK